jgi:hypothetical protein
VAVTASWGTSKHTQPVALDSPSTMAAHIIAEAKGAAGATPVAPEAVKQLNGECCGAADADAAGWPPRHASTHGVMLLPWVAAPSLCIHMCSPTTLAVRHTRHVLAMRSMLAGTAARHRHPCLVYTGRMA